MTRWYEYIMDRLEGKVEGGWEWERRWPVVRAYCEVEDRGWEWAEAIAKKRWDGCDPPWRKGEPVESHAKMVQRTLQK